MKRAICLNICLLAVFWLLVSQKQPLGAQPLPTATAFTTLSAPSATPAPAIQFGQAVSGQLTPPEDAARYRFHAGPGDVIALAVEAAGFEPTLILLDQAETRVIAIERAEDGGRKARLRLVIGDAGDYVVKVLVLSGGPPTDRHFTLSLTLQNPTPTPSPLSNTPHLAPLRPEQAIRADLDERTAFRLYGLRARRDMTIRAELTVDSSLKAGLYLYSADLADQIASAVLGQQLVAVAPEDGVYWVVAAREAQGGAGAFTLRLLEPAELPSDLVLPTLPSVVAGQRQPANVGTHFGAVYSLDVRAGTVIRLSFESPSDLTLVVLLADAAFNQIGYGLSSLPAALIEKNEPHFIVIARQGGPNDTASGDFAFTLQGSVVQTQPALAPTSTLRIVTPEPTFTVDFPVISFGQTVQGEITAQQFIAYYVFRGNQGDVITVRMQQVPGFILDPAVYVYLYSGGQRVLIASKAGYGGAAEIANLTLPASGLYLIVATRAGAAEGRTQGPFTLSLTKTR